MRPFMPRGRHAGGLAAGVETAEGDHPPAQSRIYSGAEGGDTAAIPCGHKAGAHAK
jgi:hypothetical protein